MKTILIKFAGPLQSWGTSSHFEIRHTDLYPSKSAVTGLIAAALGCKRGDDIIISKLNNMDYAVRIDQEGNLLEDYQTAHKYKYIPDAVLERTYVTRRIYIEDAVFVAAIGCAEEQWIDDIVLALEKPYFQLYAGRRSCPLLFDSYLGCVKGDVISALHDIPWQAADWYKKRSHFDKEEKVGLHVYSDAGLLSTEKSVRLRRDSIISISEKSRKYEYRSESEAVIEIDRGLTNMTEEHDAFGAI